MSETDPSIFVDPALKVAVSRAWSHEAAPAALRDRARQAMIEAADAPIRLARSDTAPRWRTWGGLALAAVFLLAVGIGLSYLTRPSDSPIASSGDETLAGGIPVSFVQNVISTHDHCGQQYLHNHHNVGCDKNDYNKIKQTIEKRLGYPVWVTPVAGWEFRGAADCRTGDGQTRCAHLLYERPDRKQTLSVFSVPYHGSCSLPPADSFAQEVQDHPVAGFVEGEELHCLVGYAPDDSLTVDELKRTTDTYRQNLHAIRIVYPDLNGTPTRLAEARR